MERIVGTRVVLMDEDIFEAMRDLSLSVSVSGYCLLTIQPLNCWQKKQTLFLHRMIMSPEKGLVVDHINGNRLDNRRENLRVCTRAQNSMNKAIPKNNTSGYKGVYFSNGRWEAIVSGVRVGRYSTPEKASLRYEDKAKEAFGEFKRPPEQYNNTPIAKDSNMVYTVGSEGEVMIRYRIEKYAEVGDPPIVSFEITRETEKCFWVAGRKHGTEVRSSKATHPIYSTFGEAKAEYIRQRRLALEDAKYRVRVYQNAVERAEELLAKAPFIQP